MADLDLKLVGIANGILVEQTDKKKADADKKKRLYASAFAYIRSQTGMNKKEFAEYLGSKVSFDAQDNRHTTEYVEGLSAYYHRMLSLGHDPLLGFVFGVYDIMHGTMTTIDKNGKFVCQVMEN